MKRLLCSLLLFAFSVRADFNVNMWQWRAQITVTPGKSISQLPITTEVFRHSTAQLNDLRIIRDTSIEVPYILRQFAGEVEQGEHPVSIRNKGWTKGAGVQAILDLEGHKEHNRLRIATDQHNFKQAVVVETSDDAKQWSTVLPDGLIFDISRPETYISDLTVTYPTSTRRYVRVTIPGWTDASFLKSAWLAEYSEADAMRSSIGQIYPVVARQPSEQTTNLIFDLGFEGQPCDRLVLQVGSGLFSRSIEISTGNDKKTWISRAGTLIDRTEHGEHTTVEWGETWDRYIKLTVFDSDNEPLKFGPATASSLLQSITFPSTATGTYWLYAGNKNARPPVYDFASTVDRTFGAEPMSAKLGSSEMNPAFRLPLPPFSERKPWVLNFILGVAVAVMAFITYRFSRRAIAKD